MGFDLAIRYRPMRVLPTMTTSSVMPKGSFMRGETLWLSKEAVNSQLSEKVSPSAFLATFYFTEVPVCDMESEFTRFSTRKGPFRSSRFRSMVSA